MKTSIVMLVTSICLIGCTTTKIKKDDHSYTYIYQHNENPESIQMNNRIKKPSSDSFTVPMKSNVKNYYQNESDDVNSASDSNNNSFVPNYGFNTNNHPLNDMTNQRNRFDQDESLSAYTPETNEMIGRKMNPQYYGNYNRNKRSYVHNYSPYPYYIPNREF